MVTTSERIFFIGGTGNVGKKTVQDLLNNKVPVTLYARDPKKVSTLFPNYDDSLLSVVQGDIQDLKPLQTALPGHTRLFLVLNDFTNFPNTKEAIAKLAFEAGVQQILDISSIGVNFPWRSSHIGYEHYLAEKKILALVEESYPNASFVVIRPGRFMSNLITFDRPTAETGGMYDTINPNAKQGWISPNDIGAISAVILQDDIKQHGPAAVYDDLIGDVVSPVKRAEIMTNILGRSITYHQISPMEKYNLIKPFPFFNFKTMYDIATMVEPEAMVSSGIQILLGREPETLEQFITANKDALL
ncbi:unnamed protein product [Cunninghamella echinulata]